MDQEAFHRAVMERFDRIESRVDARFDHVDARMDALGGKLDVIDEKFVARFDRTDRRMDAIAAPMDDVENRIEDVVGRLALLQATVNQVTEGTTRALDALATVSKRVTRLENPDG